MLSFVLKQNIQINGETSSHSLTSRAMTDHCPSSNRLHALLTYGHTSYKKERMAHSLLKPLIIARW